MNDNHDLNETELTRVSNALDALENHNHQPTTNAWEAIMEESTHRARRFSRRTQLVSVAAAAALILAIAGTVIAVSNNGNKTVNTVDKKKHETVSTSTTTTIALTDEQKLLQNSVIVTRTKINGEAYDSYDLDSTLKLTDGLTGEEIPKFKDFLKNAKIFNPQLTYVGGNVVRVEDGASPSCDDVTSHYFNIKTKETATVTGKVGSGRVYSPSGKKYAEFKATCPGEDNWLVTMTIVDTKTGSKRVIKPEVFVNEGEFSAEPNSMINPVNVKWIDENRFLLSTSVSTANGAHWSIEDLRNPISLNAAVKSDTVLPTSTDGSVAAQDVKIVNGKTLALILRYNSDIETSSATVQDVESGEIVWTKTFSNSIIDGFGSNMVLSKDGDGIYGSAYRGDGEGSFMYKHSTDKYTYPSGSIVLQLQ